MALSQPKVSTVEIGWLDDDVQAPSWKREDILTSTLTDYVEALGLAATVNVERSG